MISAAASFCLSGISSVNIRDPEWRFSRSCRNIKETWAQNYDGAMTVAPHGVCIVGWDDDYAASNFSTLPPGNGAWIVKNSYGYVFYRKIRSPYCVLPAAEKSCIPAFFCISSDFTCIRSENMQSLTYKSYNPEQI